MKQALRHLKAGDPVLRQIIEHIGPYSIEYRAPDFGTLVRSIVYQQVSGKAAATILARLIAASKRLTPAAVLKLSVEDMRACGLSGQKTAYIRDLAEKTLAREVRFPQLAKLPDEEVIAHLTQVKGVGVWTAQMFLMFALARPDVLPTADLGIRSAMKRAYGLEELPKPDEMARIAQPWKPWTSVACWYLWRSLDGPATL
ncbi:MAG: DNA-3-methyladenine glycosylase [Bryobacteraceae bacterium]|nr:DNA-3-methyladenine glycosylase [Bryobacteraceae bacterium]